MFQTFAQQWRPEIQSRDVGSGQLHHQGFGSSKPYKNDFGCWGSQTSSTKLAMQVATADWFTEFELSLKRHGICRRRRSMLNVRVATCKTIIPRHSTIVANQ